MQRSLFLLLTFALGCSAVLILPRPATPQDRSSTTPHFVPVRTSPTAITAVFEVRLPGTFGSVAFAGVSVRGVGSTRYYVSPALPPGKVYAGTVRATWKRPGGYVVTETRKVEAWAGHTTKVDFTRPARKAPAAPAHTDRPAYLLPVR
jgi:uncharacterized protein (TIGR03000 family)